MPLTHLKSMTMPLKWVSILAKYLHNLYFQYQQLKIEILQPHMWSLLHPLESSKPSRRLFMGKLFENRRIYQYVEKSKTIIEDKVVIKSLVGTYLVSQTFSGLIYCHRKKDNNNWISVIIWNSICYCHIFLSFNLKSKSKSIFTK